jgi:SAM-dependent methyltransferase
MMLAMLAVANRLGRGVGFDSSAPATDAAARMLARLRDERPGVDLTVTRLDVADPWPDGAFDVVMMVDVMHHIPPPAQESVLRAAARRVRPGGGRLLYKDMARRPAWRATMNRLHDLVVARQWIHYCPIQDIERWATDEGLSPAVASDSSLLWYRHELRVFTRP